MNRFWIVIAIVVVALVGLFVATKPKQSGDANFKGDAKVVQSDDYVRNGKGKTVTLIEYGDFQCPICGGYYPILKQLESEYADQVSFVYRYFPLISIHANAFSAARAAQAAGNQGKFWEMHDKLYETQSSWGEVTSNQQSLFEGYAEDLGLNMTKFKTDYASQATSDRINRDISSGSQFKIDGTPTFILNGQKIELPGYQDKAPFEKVLNDAIKKAGGTPPKAE